MLKGDMLFLHSERLHGEVLQHLESLSAMGSLTWARAAQVAEVEVHEIRHAVITAAMTSFGFLSHEVFAIVWGEVFLYVEATSLTALLHCVCERGRSTMSEFGE